MISKLNENSSISEDEKQEIIKLYNNIDMDQLRDANPKLFEYLYFDPTKIMDFKSSIAEQAELKAQTAIDTEAMDAATTASQSTPKVYTLPLFWKWLTPVFAVTSGWLLSIQAATNIPWLPFLIIWGVGVRLIMAPLMIRQMVRIIWIIKFRLISIKWVLLLLIWESLENYLSISKEECRQNYYGHSKVYIYNVKKNRN